METNTMQTEDTLRNLFIRQLNILKLNRDKVPLHILKTQYRKGYETLCQELKTTGSQYTKQLTLSGIRFHKDYIEEGSEKINRVIEQSGMMTKLSRAVFAEQSIDNFEALCDELRILIEKEADIFYRKHLGLLLTEEGLTKETAVPLVFSFANGCFLIDNKWVPKELYNYQ